MKKMRRKKTTKNFSGYKKSHKNAGLKESLRDNERQASARMKRTRRARRG